MTSLCDVYIWLFLLNLADGPTALCLWCRALADANSALRIDINWAKGFYRRGRGLAGLKVSETVPVAPAGGEPSRLFTLY